MCRSCSTIVIEHDIKFSQHINKSILINYSVSQGNIKRKECDIWQHKYWEHIIRDENDLNKHLDYIHYNPIKHGQVKALKDWEYSSFHKFVKNGFYENNWCNFDDINNISIINYE